MEGDEDREAEDGPLRAILTVVRSLCFILKVIVEINTISKVKRQMLNLETIFYTEIQDLLL